MLRAVWIHVALLTWMELESERVESNMEVGFRQGILLPL